MTAKADIQSEFLRRLAIQIRVIWALILRETITRYGRENIGVLWFFAEPLLFTLGVTLLWTYLDARTISAGTIAEFTIISYPTILLWRNATGRVVKAMEANRPLLHHRPIRAMDFFYSRIALEYASVTATMILLYLVFLGLGIAHLPADLLAMILGWLLCAWFSFGFVIVMGALSELSDVIEKISHVIIYFMLPISGAIIPAAVLPESLRKYLLLFPLADSVEYFRHGYYGTSLPCYYDLAYTVVVDLLLTLFALALMVRAMRRLELQ